VTGTLRQKELPAGASLGGPLMADHEYDEAGLARSVAEVREKSVTERLRLIGMACATVIAMLLLATLLVGEDLPIPYTPLRFAGLVAVLAFVLASYRPAFTRHQALWGWLLITFMASLASYGAVSRRNPAIAGILETMLTLLTSAVLPWGLPVQAINIATCAALFYFAIWQLGPYPAGDPHIPVIVDTTAAFVLSLFVAYGSRRLFDKAAAENLRLVDARSRIRILADQLEAKVKSRTAELEATLEDQRATTRAISHDLRQPLRHIASFTQMLRDDLADSLGDDHREQLARVASATARMDRMVDAMLEISRVAGKPLEAGNVDVSRIATELGAELARLDPEHRVELTVDAGMTAVGDPALVRSLLHELMENAWKFTRGREVPDVHVGRENQVFFVRDSGAGFDMRYASKMYETFERLHHANEFEGEGAGLAIARRVVRRHGGRLWAESQPNHGATFYFTLSPE
jgi:signal transduction histidine kinase